MTAGASGVLFGLAFAAVAVGVNRILPAGPLRRAMMALLLAAAAAVYVGASLGDLPGSAAIQSAAFLLFGALALAGWNRAGILAAGWLAHAGWDLLHLAEVLASGTPRWYQVGCLVADPLLAAWLLFGVGFGAGGRIRAVSK